MIDLATLGELDAQWLKNTLSGSNTAGFSETEFLYCLLGKQLQSQTITSSKKSQLFRLMLMAERMHRIKSGLKTN